MRHLEVLAKCAAAAALLSAPACLGPSALPAPARPGDAGTEALPPVPATGAVNLTVRWPDRNTLAIPQNATRIDFRGTMASQPSLLKTVSLQRPAATASLSEIPEGSLSIEAKAYDSGNLVVATGSTEVYVKPNQRVPAKIVLGSGGSGSGALSVTSFDPAFGFVGDSIAIGYSGTSIQPQVDFGGVQASTFTFLGKLNAAVPVGAKTGKIGLAAEGATGQSTASFFVIGAVSLSPASPGPVAAGSKIQFVLTGTDSLGATASTPVITCSCDDADGKNFQQRAAGTITAGYLYTAGATGRDRINCGKGSATQSVIVVVQ